ncbi:MAG: SET domain-containing protein [Candidatus Vogelbacteria bacterium]|nr:SET domain-containing protein [Candidatus Vogelbacteria bacterium]
MTRKRSKAIFRLEPSPVHGVGVFTHHFILKGTYLPLFAENDYKFRHTAQTSYRERKFLERYGIKERKLGYHGSADFNRMSVGWYLNHSKTPNVGHKNFRYYALRDIHPREEILIDYATLYTN